MFKKIINSAQIGVEIAALTAAVRTGIQTGGYMPEGCLTAIGPRQDWMESYGLSETDSPFHDVDIRNNIVNSQGTLLIYKKLTDEVENVLNIIKQEKMPHISYDFNVSLNVNINKIINWMDKYNIEILYVTGNNETNSPGIINQSYKIIKFLINAKHKK